MVILKKIYEEFLYIGIQVLTENHESLIEKGL